MIALHNYQGFNPKPKTLGRIIKGIYREFFRCHPKELNPQLNRCREVWENIWRESKEFINKWYPRTIKFLRSFLTLAIVSLMIIGIFVQLYLSVSNRPIKKYDAKNHQWVIAESIKK